LAPVALLQSQEIRGFPARTEQNEVIRVEVVDAEERVTRGDAKAVVETASVAFEQALGKLQPMCAAIVGQVWDAVEQPEEVSVEFGVKLSAEAGIILAATSGEANLKISVKWKKQEPKIEKT
jgi:Trypsin-co-occurring domain 1